MAPKVQFSREKIIRAAIDLTRKEGIEAVTVRRLGRELGCSVKPIFTAFENMDEVISETAKKANSIFIEHMEKPYEKLSFMRIGLRWLDFAKTEPELYKLLFMPVNKGGRAISPLKLFENFNGLTAKVMPVIQKEFGLNDVYSLKLYNQMIIHTHGIACLLVGGDSEFSEQNIREIFSETAESLVVRYKAMQERERD